MPKLVKDNTYTQTHFAARLNQLLQDNRLTQDELAKYVGITRQTVSSWKDGKTVPDIESLFKMCKRFDVTADYLIGLSDDPQRRPSAVDQLGLTLEACEILKKKKGYPRYGEFISEVIRVGTILAP